MSRRLFIIVFIVIALPIAWYLISPLWRVEERNEASPLTAPQVHDAFDDMTPEKKAQFETAVEKAQGEIKTMGEAMPQSSARIIAQGEFMTRAHEVEGRALLIETPSGKIIRFEEFETINGPNLHIYLASSLGDEDYVDLGAIRATKGNVNYEVPAGVDTARYSKVLVWCGPFQVLFSYAELN